MSRHLSCDGTRFHHDGHPVRAADLQIGDTYTHADPNRPTTVTGAPYPGTVDTLQGHTVPVIHIPARLHDGTNFHDTAEPDTKEEEGLL